MVRSEYLELGCRSIGQKCDYNARAETEREVLHLFNSHLCEIHAFCSFDSKHMKKISSAIRSIWCQEEDCGYAPGTGWGWG
jgi:predicted small metal-binding protein